MQYTLFFLIFSFAFVFCNNINNSIYYLAIDGINSTDFTYLYLISTEKIFGYSSKLDVFAYRDVVVSEDTISSEFASVKCLGSKCYNDDEEMKVEVINEEKFYNILETWLAEIKNWILNKMNETKIENIKKMNDKEIKNIKIVNYYQEEKNKRHLENNMLNFSAYLEEYDTTQYKGYFLTTKSYAKITMTSTDITKVFYEIQSLNEISSTELELSIKCDNVLSTTCENYDLSTIYLSLIDDKIKLKENTIDPEKILDIESDEIYVLENSLKYISNKYNGLDNNLGFYYDEQYFDYNNFYSYITLDYYIILYLMDTENFTVFGPASGSHIEYENGYYYNYNKYKWKNGNNDVLITDILDYEIKPPFVSWKRAYKLNVMDKNELYSHAEERINYSIERIKGNNIPIPTGTINTDNISSIHSIAFVMMILILLILL